MRSKLLDTALLLMLCTLVSCTDYTVSSNVELTPDYVANGYIRAATGDTLSYLLFSTTCQIRMNPDSSVDTVQRHDTVMMQDHILSGSEKGITSLAFNELLWYPTPLSNLSFYPVTVSTNQLLFNGKPLLDNQRAIGQVYHDTLEGYDSWSPKVYGTTVLANKNYSFQYNEKLYSVDHYYRTEVNSTGTMKIDRQIMVAPNNMIVHVKLNGRIMYSNTGNTKEGADFTTLFVDIQIKKRRVN